MGGYVILGTLAAMGLMSLIWVFAGALIPGAKGGIVVCPQWPGESFLWRYRWLRDIGLLQCPVIVVTENTDGENTKRLCGCDIELCSPDALGQRLERERKYLDGTGNGDPPGRHQRRGISEL